jgi:hypothetical protein
MVKFIEKEAIVSCCQRSPEKKTLKRGHRKQETRREDGKKKGNGREEEIEVGNAGNVPTCPVPMRSHFNKLNGDIPFRRYDCTTQTPGF